MGLPENLIPIEEIFVSVQGEGVNLGVPYVFVRVAGCPLRCNFCDSERTWKAKKDQLREVESVIDDVILLCRKYGIEWVSITGGEPLLYQKQVKHMLHEFYLYGFKTHVETSGRFYDQELHVATNIYSPDAKTPCTGETMPGFCLGIENLRTKDQIKCLIATEDDFAYAHKVNLATYGRPTMVLQPFNMNVLTDSTAHMPEDMANARPFEAVQHHILQRNLCNSYRWLLETFKKRCEAGEVWSRVVLTPQVHVLAFGNEAGR